MAILKRHTFVGIADTTFSLIQHDTKLLLVRHVDLGSVPSSSSTRVFLL